MKIGGGLSDGLNPHEAPLCNCCQKRVARIILPHTSFNDSTRHLFHCKITGQITQIKDADWVVV